MVHDAASFPACRFCSFRTVLPEYVVHETSQWLAVHADEFFTLGTLYLISKRHCLLPSLTLSEWSEAGPLIRACSRMLTHDDRADRTYMAAFSERSTHFHLVIYGKQIAHSMRHDGKCGSALLAAIVSENAPIEPEEAKQKVRTYRARFAEYLTESAPAPL